MSVRKVVEGSDGKLTFELDDGSIVVRDLLVSGGGGSTTVANNLTTNDSAQALSAAQGVALKTLVDAKAGTAAATTTVDGLQSAADKTKLNGIATAATANATDANLRDRSTHTGAQLAATISDFDAAARATALTGLSVATSTAVAATDSTLAAIGKLQAQTTLRATLASPTFTGVPNVPTATTGTNTTQAASTAFVQTEIATKQDVTGVPSAFTSRALTNTDNGDILICASAQVATVNTGLTSGFGCSFKGIITFAGTATVTDIRTTGAANPWCALMQTGTNTYDVVGGKA